MDKQLRVGISGPEVKLGRAVRLVRRPRGVSLAQTHQDLHEEGTANAGRFICLHGPRIAESIRPR